MGIENNEFIARLIFSKRGLTNGECFNNSFDDLFKEKRGLELSVLRIGLKSFKADYHTTTQQISSPCLGYAQAKVGDIRNLKLESQNILDVKSSDTKKKPSHCDIFWRTDVSEKEVLLIKNVVVYKLRKVFSQSGGLKFPQ